MNAHNCRPVAKRNEQCSGFLDELPSCLQDYKGTRESNLRSICRPACHTPHGAGASASDIRPNSGKFLLRRRRLTPSVRLFAVHVSTRVRPRPHWAWPGQREQLVSCRMGGRTLWTLFSCRRRRRRSFCGVLMSQSRNPCCAIPPF